MRLVVVQLRGHWRGNSMTVHVSIYLLFTQYTKNVRRKQTNVYNTVFLHISVSSRNTFVRCCEVYALINS